MRHGVLIAGSVVLLAASGCLGEGSANPTTASSPPPAPTGRMTVVVRLGLRTHMPVTHHYLLTCHPAGGTMQHAAAACAAIADYRMRGEPNGACIGATSPPTAATRIVGTYGHHRLDLDIKPQLWCGQSRPVMRDFWVLSTFPCSTVVEHTQNIQPYAKFARATGCERSVIRNTYTSRSATMSEVPVHPTPHLESSQVDAV
jgi:hypothetical protein